MQLDDYEKLGVFYLGKEYDLAERKLLETPLLYASKDLTTHAVCVGMTGSGKTGLCLSLLEEAAIDGIPAIAIDPKGDLGNLLLTFPELRPDDFRPWIDESEAAAKGLTADDYAAQTAVRWREGLASWNQPPERIQRFRDAVDLAIYTPGSSAGLPLTVLRSFAAPPAELLEDADAYRARLTAAASGLLSLLGVNADPIRDREHILISMLLDDAWRQGRDLDVATLIAEIQQPPFDQVGVVGIDQFFPPKDRTALAMTLNSLLASPSFAGWMEGDPLDVKRLLYTPEGKPRLSILSIAHLSDAERMFFVTILLNEVLAWVRTQPGSSSFRALLYMDEVFGYFPPTANPPSKTPMLTLLKQARAYGLGIVLATQNPVDLDYKGLSNTGTWFLGRLQTERDKLRVLEGLEGASLEAGASFDRGRMAATLAALGSRVFLMNNVHEDAPVVFQTRWALSYLRGPLTRGQIQTLMAPVKQARQTADTSSAPQTSPTAAPPSAAPLNKPVSPAALADDFGDLTPVAAMPPSTANERPNIPAVAAEQFEVPPAPLAPGEVPRYRPTLLGVGKMRFVRAAANIDQQREAALLHRVDADALQNPWAEADAVEPGFLQLAEAPADGAAFEPYPPELADARSYAAWGRQLRDHLYNTQTATVWRCVELKQYSQLDETEGDFRIRLRHLAHEQRDAEMEKLRARFAARLRTAEERIRTAEAGVSREKSQRNKAAIDTFASAASTFLGGLFGRKTASRTNVSKATATARSAGRTLEQHGDIRAAQARLDARQDELNRLTVELEQELDRVAARYDIGQLTLERIELKPRKTDLQVEPVRLIWRL